MPTYYTPIVAGTAANADTFNDVFDEFDTALINLAGGADVTNQTLKEWTEGGDYELTAITYDATYTSVIASGTVKWPDGSAGTFTTDTINTTWQAIDAYHITHADSGKTVTQAAVTRNGSGNITAKPALTI